MSHCMRKPATCIGENKDADQLCTAQLISAFVFATQIVQYLFHFNPKFHSVTVQPVCVGPGRKPKLLVFSCTGSGYFNRDPTLFHICKSYLKVHNVHVPEYHPAITEDKSQGFLTDRTAH